MEHIGNRVELLLLQQKHEGGSTKDKTRAHCPLEVHSRSIGENRFFSGGSIQCGLFERLQGGEEELHPHCYCVCPTTLHNKMSFRVALHRTLRSLEHHFNAWGAGRQTSDSPRRSHRCCGVSGKRIWCALSSEGTHALAQARTQHRTGAVREDRG